MSDQTKESVTEARWRKRSAKILTNMQPFKMSYWRRQGRISSSYQTKTLNLHFIWNCDIMFVRILDSRLGHHCRGATSYVESLRNLIDFVIWWWSYKNELKCCFYFMYIISQKFGFFCTWCFRWIFGVSCFVYILVIYAWMGRHFGTWFPSVRFEHSFHWAWGKRGKPWQTPK